MSGRKNRERRKMKNHVNYPIPPELQEQINMSEARRQAKDMACIKYCGDGIKTKGTVHQFACPYWDPFRRKNHIDSKGGEK